MDNNAIEERKKYLVARGGCIFYYIRDYYTDHEDAYETLLRDIPWEQYTNTRLSYFMGQEGTVYPDSDKYAHSWHWIVLNMKDKLQKDLGCELNSCLLNYYPNGNAGLALHSDRECSGHGNATIGITLGATRHLVLKQNKIVKDTITNSYENDVTYERNTKGEVYRIVYPVQAGDLYVMGGYFHACWKHSLPARRKIKKGRISLTFRKLHY